MEKIITKKQVINKIGQELELGLKIYGFRFLKSKSMLKRKTKQGYDAIILSTYDMYPHSHQELFIQFSFRIDKVEEIVNKFYDERFMNPEFHKSSRTYSLNHESLMNDYKIEFNSLNNQCDICKPEKEKKLVLHSEEDIVKLIPLLINFIKIKGLTFFEVNYNLDYLNSFIKQQALECGYLLQLMQSLVLMYLTGDKDLNGAMEEYPKLLLQYPYDKDKTDALNELVTYLILENRKI